MLDNCIKAVTGFNRYAFTLSPEVNIENRIMKLFCIHHIYFYL